MADRRGRTSSAYPGAVERAIEAFSALPGIGKRSAERIVFALLTSEADGAEALARSVRELKEQVRHCPECFNFAETVPCAVCSDPERDRTRVLVVERPRDLIALEQTGMYRGLYHVLMGRLSPLEGVGPGELTVGALLERARSRGVEEVILGLNPTLEGDGTALYLAEELRAIGVRVTRLARGLPTGSSLEFANKAVLADAIEGRRTME